MGLCECGCGLPTSIARTTNRSKGWVKGEPLRFRRGHTPAPRNPVERFWRNTEKTAECWFWKGAINDAGYGLICLMRHRSPVRAHRFAYELLVGPIPEGLQLDHLCRNRACVNPDHLEPVTSAENTRRGNTAKLDWGQVEEIRASSEDAPALAAMYGVSTNRIYDLRNGLGWTQQEAPACSS